MNSPELREFITLLLEIKKDLEKIKESLEEQEARLDGKIEALKKEIPTIVERQIEAWIVKKSFAPYVIFPILAGMTMSLIGLYHIIQYAVRIFQQIFQTVPKP